jgi:nucleoside-diphosphate-sugar epimerase
MKTYAILGATGNCGSAIISLLLQRHTTKFRIHAYCRNKSKLLKRFPDLELDERVRIFEGGLDNAELLATCLRDCRAVFLCISTNDNIPGCRLSQDSTSAVIHALKLLKQSPKLLLLSSATIDDNFSRHVPFLLRQILLRSASNVYADLVATEALLRDQASWLTSVFIKPGALSVDQQRGHALSLTDENSPLSYLDLAAGMLEAADDDDGLYDGKDVSVVNTGGRASFPTGTPLCILTGLLRHFFPWMHEWLPSTGPS